MSSKSILRAALSAALVTAALAAPSTASAATGWRCQADALTGSVLGQALPGAVSQGSATADCTTGQAAQPLSVPPLLSLGTLAASTGAQGRNVVATGGIVDLGIHSTPQLPITLPQITIPSELTTIPIAIGGINVATVDLTP